MTQSFDDPNRDLDQNFPTADDQAADTGPHEGDIEGSEERDERHDGGRRDRERRPRIDSFEKMKVWQESHALAMKVFGITPKLPADQQAGLALQMEQAAVAVPRTIAEGFKRRGPRNKAHFYNMAQTSLEGLRYYFILCRDLGYDIGYDDVAMRVEQVSRMLDGLVRAMMR